MHAYAESNLHEFKYSSAVPMHTHNNTSEHLIWRIPLSRKEYSGSFQKSQPLILHHIANTARKSH